MELFDEYPYLVGDKIIIKKMTVDDVDNLMEITSNDNVYKYIPPFLHNKSRNFLISAITNITGRDFEKKKLLLPGIYLKDDPNHLIGMAEMFDFKRRDKTITIGYRFNEAYWHKGYAKEAVSLMKNYLLNDMNLSKLNAFIIKENIYSGKVLLANGFIKQDEPVAGENWGNETKVTLDHYILTK